MSQGTVEPELSAIMISHGLVKVSVGLIKCSDRGDCFLRPEDEYQLFAYSFGLSQSLQVLFSGGHGILDPFFRNLEAFRCSG